MNEIITEFQDDDINSNYILNYINKLKTKVNYKITNVDEAQYISAGQGYGKKLTYISSTYIVFGDSYTDGVVAYEPEWHLVLGTLLSKTALSYAVNGTTSDQMQKYINNMILDTANAQRTSIIAYGVNDGRRTALLFRTYSLYANVLLNNYLMCTVPQNKCFACRSFTTKSGTWANTGTSDNTGLFSLDLNAYLEHTFTNVRYIYFSGYYIKGENRDMTIRINGVIYGRYKINNGPEAGVNTGGLYASYGLLIDIGEVLPSCVLRFTNNLAYTAPQLGFYASYVCCWNDTDQLSNTRNLLVATIPKYYKYASDDNATGNNFTDEKRRLLNECIVNAALACVRHGLNVSVISYSQLNGLYSDKLHPSIFQSAMFAYDIKNIATTL